jgi:hypothetical protein
VIGVCGVAHAEEEAEGDDGEYRDHVRGTKIAFAARDGMRSVAEPA